MNRSEGYTLFEILVVLGILALVVGLVYPSLTGILNRARMNGTVRDLATYLKFSREKALAEQEVIAVVLRRQERDVTIFGADNKVLKHYTLADKVHFDRIILDGQDVEDNRAVVWFYPDGRSTGVALILKSDAGRQLRLKTDLLTGTTRIFSPGEKGFEDEVFVQ